MTTHVGKEASKLEEAGAVIERDPDEVWTEYRDPMRNLRATLVLPVLKQILIERLVAATGMHRRSLFAIRAGERLPHPRNRQALLAADGAVAREQWQEAGSKPPSDDLVGCAVYRDSAYLMG